MSTEKISTVLDSIDNRLEARGMVKEAHTLNMITNTVEDNTVTKLSTDFSKKQEIELNELPAHIKTAITGLDATKAAIGSAKTEWDCFNVYTSDTDFDVDQLRRLLNGGLIYMSTDLETSDSAIGGAYASTNLTFKK